MSQNVHLITGHQNTNHIEAIDERALNRAIFGGDNYRLNWRDASSINVVGCELSSQTVSGGRKAVIVRGQILWNGMFIRVNNNIITDETYESLSGMKVYIHYIRTDEIENVDFVFTFDDSSFSSKIKNTNDWGSENPAEVYCLFGTYNNASGSSKTDIFPAKKPAVTLVEEEASTRASAVSSLTTSVNGKVNTSTYNTDQTAVQTKIDQKVNLKPFSVSTVGDTYDRKLLGSLSVPQSTTETSAGTRVSATLNETIEHFAFIEVRIGGNGVQKTAGIIPTCMLRDSSNGSAWGGDAVTPRCVRYFASYTGVYSMFMAVSVSGTNAYSYPYKLYNGTTFLTNSGSYGGSQTVYFYGVGRVSS